MTIKSNGGVFGRNPTFYNVNVDGKLTGGALRGSSLGIGVDSLSYLAEFAKAGAASYLMVNTTGATPSGLLIGAEGAKNSIYSGTGPGNLAGKPLFLYQGFTHVCNTTATGNLAFPSGQGIDFSATAGTGTSELFSDYEEGTWTPVISAGWSSVTYAAQLGTYTKTGNMVTAWFYIQFSGTSTASNVTMSGLPFTYSGSNANKFGSLSYIDAPMGGGSKAIVPYIGINNTIVSFYEIPASVQVASTGNSSSKYIVGGVTYPV
jgi:hypothetical protein